MDVMGTGASPHRRPYFANSVATRLAPCAKLGIAAAMVSTFCSLSPNKTPAAASSSLTCNPVVTFSRCPRRQRHDRRGSSVVLLLPQLAAGLPHLECSMRTESTDVANRLCTQSTTVESNCPRSNMATVCRKLRCTAMSFVLALRAEQVHGASH